MLTPRKQRLTANSADGGHYLPAHCWTLARQGVGAGLPLPRFPRRDRSTEGSRGQERPWRWPELPGPLAAAPRLGPARRHQRGRQHVPP